RRHRQTTFVELAKDHFARGGLQYRGDRDVDVLADHLARVVDYDHGAVIEIGNTLVVLLAFLRDKDAHDFARQPNGLQGISKLVDVQDRDALKLRNLVQVEVVGDDLAFV